MNPNGQAEAQLGGRYWLTAKAYEALGVTPPADVVATDLELGLIPAAPRA